MTVNGVNRAPATLVGAAIAGALLWVAAAYVDRHTNGGYWAAYGIIAGAGFAFGLSQLRGGGGHPPAMFLLAFLPVLIAVGWVGFAMQPHTGFGSGTVRGWSSDIGILDVVRTVGTWLGVLAFGLGYTLAATFEPLTRRRVVAEPPVDGTAADAPTTAERRELARDRETVTR
ncbi:MAG TPA: hypothetical protein VFB25_02210 [Gaiellaceae bacterium]|nr:hypothetical protein [Gaiellaceae bacterium]